MTARAVRAWRADLAFRRPWTVAPGRTLRTRRSWFVQLRLADGSPGWGEAVHLPGFTRESVETIEDALLTACAHGIESREAAMPPTVRAAWAMAMDPALSSAGGLDAIQLPLCGLIQEDPEQWAEALAARVRQGLRTVKIKLGRAPLAQEIPALAHLLPRAAESGMALRLDANQTLSMADLIAFSEACTEGRESIQYWEEPLRDESDRWRIPAELDWPVAVDESFRASGGVVPDWAAAVVWKPSLGPPPPAVFPRAGRVGRLVVSSAYESALGVRALAGWAARIAPGTAAGLDTLSALADALPAPLPPVRHGCLCLAGWPSPAELVSALNPRLIFHG